MALNGFEGVFKTLEEMGTGCSKTTRLRKDIFNDKWGNIEVDTCIAFDTDKWETGICKDGGDWIIVQQYEDREDAKSGHNQWVKKLRDNPNIELEDINLWNL